VLAAGGLDAAEDAHAAGSLWSAPAKAGRPLP